VIVGTLGLLGFVALWLYSDGTPLDVLTAAIATIGAVAVALLVPRQPVSAVGVVFLLAVFERLSLQLPAGEMRLEQPALLTLIVATGVYRSRLDLPSVRPLLPLIAAALVYLAALTASSLLVADQPLASMRMVAWSALSMLGGLVVALLVAGRAGRALPWLSGSAAVVATIGMVSAIGFLLFALGDPWVGGTEHFSPKVNALSHEPNLYASLLAAAIPLAAEMWRERPRIRNTVIVSVLLLAIGLGVTRAAYIGLAVGLVVYFALTVRREGFGADLKKLVAIIALTGAIGLVLPLLLLNPYQQGMLLAEPPRPLTPSLEEGDEPADDLAGQLDTLGYRLDQVMIGFDEFAESPLIGRGAFAFGQRHTEPRGGPAVIAIWPFAVAYDAGLVGLIALSTFFVLLARRVWRVARDKLLGGAAVAFGAAVTVLVVAYLATTALHFAVTWIFIGCAVGATIPWRRPTSEESEISAQPVLAETPG
jgi:hypothetical protein